MNETKGNARQRGDRPDVQKLRRITRVACGEEKADLVLKRAAFVNVFTNEMDFGDIAVVQGTIAGIGQYSAEREIDMQGRIVLPGFIDTHIHLESSLLTPAKFAGSVVPHGTTTVITDPHEIANVCGTTGIDYMLAASQGLPLDVFVMLPSCVPSVPFEENGAALSWQDLHAYIHHPRVLGLAEMMNYPGVIAGDDEVLSKIAEAQKHGRRIDGHAPGLSGNALQAYIATGVYSDHECDEMDNALEKLSRGQAIMIREGTAAQNLEALIPLLRWQYHERCMFATDDKHPLDLCEKGHIDYICRRAVALGAEPLLVAKIATYCAARHFGLGDRGAIAPGYAADFAVVGDLTDFEVQMTVKDGEIVYDGRCVQIHEPEVPPQILDRVVHTMNMPEVDAAQFADGDCKPVIELLPGSIVTRDAGEANGIDTQRDILKMVVAERHRGTGHVAFCYAKGYGMKRGAVATSIAHDSHNLIACGANDADIALVMNTVRGMGGGMAVACEGKVLASLALPVAGLMSWQPLEQVNEQLEACKSEAAALGASRGVDPFMTLSFASLPVIPVLRLTTKGVFDVDKQKFRG